MKYLIDPKTFILCVMHLPIIKKVPKTLDAPQNILFVCNAFACDEKIFKEPKCLWLMHRCIFRGQQIIQIAQHTPKHHMFNKSQSIPFEYEAPRMKDLKYLIYSKISLLYVMYSPNTKKY